MKRRSTTDKMRWNGRLIPIFVEPVRVEYGRGFYWDEFQASIEVRLNKRQIQNLREHAKREQYDTYLAVGREIVISLLFGYVYFNLMSPSQEIKIVREGLTETEAINMVGDDLDRLSIIVNSP